MGCAVLALVALLAIVLVWATGVPLPWTLRAEGRARAAQCTTARTLEASIRTPPRCAPRKVSKT